MKKKELLQLFGALNQMGSVTGPKFSYAIVRNINRLKPEVEAIESGVKMTDEYAEFDKKRVALAKEHAKKDENGSEVITNNAYDVEDTFYPAFEALKEENKDLVEAREKQLADYLALLEEEIDVDLFKVPADVLPETINAAQLNSIFAIIE